MFGKQTSPLLPESITIRTKSKSCSYHPITSFLCHLVPRRCKCLSLRQALLLFVVLTAASFFVIPSYLSDTSSSPTSGMLIRSHPPVPSFTCPGDKRTTNLFKETRLDNQSPTVLLANNSRESSLVSSESLESNTFSRKDPSLKILVLVETQYSFLGRQIVEVVEAARFKVKVEISGKSLPLLTNLDRGKYAVIVFENLDRYLKMNKWNRELLDKYCLEYRVGIIGFLPYSKGSDQSVVQSKMTGIPLRGFPLYADTKLTVRDYRLETSSPVFRLIRSSPRLVVDGLVSGGNHWTGIQSNDPSFEAIATAVKIDESKDNLTSFDNNNNTIPEERVATIVLDKGSFDGIQRVIFGSGLDSLWIHKIIFLDCISFLSHDRLSLPLKRYLLIDIDDIFVGETGTRMKRQDVFSLLEAQKKIRSMIPGFRFNLGFSGKYYHKGSDEEDEGDDELIRQSDNFWWFCHMWSHSQPHLYNLTSLETEMKMNKEFAVKNGIPTDSGYSIAPHHSGVYPVHEALYEAWKSVWDVKVTSTEEYPHLRPARLRRGFLHQGISVLPRQTCGLYTHTIFYDKYPGGADKLDKSIFGGELFYTLVLNPVNIFMTHLSNYGNDRLAIYTFESVLSFISCWTNLVFETVPPKDLASVYFSIHPEESDPVWTNPCMDKRHISIWSVNKSCEQLPKFLVVGPQKTGTTALYTFLSMHPSIQSNFMSSESFEEVQFFSGKNYYKGLDWYMNYFPSTNKNVSHDKSNVVLFEKSATYFDGEQVPLRVHSLLPSAKIIVILISPIRRAYSWYQHMKSHSDATALYYSFQEVVTADEKSSPKGLRDLKHRCLNPGLYAQHLDRWLNYFPPQQLMIIDGEELKLDPVAVLSRLQVFLKIEPFVDYKNLIRFDSRKGFYCPVSLLNNSTKCLGRGKGRRYEEMTEETEKMLRDYFMPFNVALSKLLTKLRQPIPVWLQEDLSHPEA